LPPSGLIRVPESAIRRVISAQFGAVIASVEQPSRSQRVTDRLPQHPSKGVTPSRCFEQRTAITLSTPGREFGGVSNSIGLRS
jgi:hypothetical protein